MSWFYHDPDEWDIVIRSEQYGCYPGTNVPFGSSCVTHRRRSESEIAQIKAERQKREEDEILTRADAIRARRGAPPA